MTRLEDRQTLIGQIAEARGNGARQAPACALAGIDPRTLQRWRKNDGLTRSDRRPDAIRPAPSHALTEEERPRIVGVDERAALRRGLARPDRSDAGRQRRLYRQ